MLNHSFGNIAAFFCRNALIAYIVSFVNNALLFVLAMYCMLSYTFLYCSLLKICFKVLIATGLLAAIILAVSNSPF